MRELSLQQALEIMGMIDRQLQAREPRQIGPRFGMLDIIPSFRAEYISFGNELALYPALRNCKTMVSNRSLLRPFLAEPI